MNVKSSVNSIIHHLHICKQNTLELSPFAAHFGKPPNTPLVNISIEPDISKHLNFTQSVTEKYLDQDLLNLTDLIPGEKLDDRIGAMQKSSKIKENVSRLPMTHKLSISGRIMTRKDRWARQTDSEDGGIGAALPSKKISDHKRSKRPTGTVWGVRPRLNGHKRGLLYVCINGARKIKSNGPQKRRC